MVEKINIPFHSYKGEEKYIFISYSHKDSNTVFPIINKYYKAGFNIWYDEGIDPGNEWPYEIENALKKCAVFLVFISPNSVASRNVRNEINFALSFNLPFLAVHLVETELTDGLALQMGSTQAIMYHRMEERSFFYKSEMVFNQLLENETTDKEPLPDDSHKIFRRKKPVWLIPLLIIAGAGIIAAAVLLRLFVFNTKNIDFNDHLSGVSFTYPSSFDLLDYSDYYFNLEEPSTGFNIFIYELSKEIAENIALNETDFQTAGEQAIGSLVWRSWNHGGVSIDEYVCRFEINDRFIAGGGGSFLLTPEGGELYIDSYGTDFYIRQFENRVFFISLSSPPEGNYIDNKKYEKYQNILDDIIKSMVVEKNPKSIEEQAAEFVAVG